MHERVGERERKLERRRVREKVPYWRSLSEWVRDSRTHPHVDVASMMLLVDDCRLKVPTTVS